MATSRNDITGDAIHTKSTSDSYRDGWDRIFGKAKKEKEYQPKMAFFLLCVEYERGWGSKPDGYFAFASEKAADSYIEEQYVSRIREIAVPDYYVNYEKSGWHPISDYALNQIIESGKPFYFSTLKDAKTWCSPLPQSNQK